MSKRLCTLWATKGFQREFCLSVGLGTAGSGSAWQRRHPNVRHSRSAHVCLRSRSRLALAQSLFGLAQRDIGFSNELILLGRHYCAADSVAISIGALRYSIFAPPQIQTLLRRRSRNCLPAVSSPNLNVTSTSQSNLQGTRFAWFECQDKYTRTENNVPRCYSTHPSLRGQERAEPPTR